MRHFGGPTSPARFVAIHGARSQWQREKKALWFERRAEEMRQKPTSLEVKLELVLDSLNINHKKHYILGDFIVDFYLPAYRSAIEADGPHHEKADQRKADERRDKILLAHHRCNVLHLRAHEFFNTEHMKKRINEFIASAPLPERKPYIERPAKPVKVKRSKFKARGQKRFRASKRALEQRQQWQLLRAKPLRYQVGQINPSQLDNPDKEITSIAGMN